MRSFIRHHWPEIIGVIAAITSMLVWVAATHAAEVTLSIDPVTWPAHHAGDPYLTNKIDFHVTANSLNRCSYPMIGFNFGLHHPADLVFAGAGLIPGEWELDVAFIDTIVSLIVYAGPNAPDPPTQSVVVTMAFYNGAPVARTPCQGNVRIYNFQAGGALCGFTTEIAPYPCTGPPSDVLEDRLAHSTWGIVKELYR